VQGLTERDDRKVGFDESGRAGNTSTATSEHGSLSMELTGESSRGEADTLAACERLVAFLNARAKIWAAPEIAQPHDDIDCVSASLGNDGSRPLRMQVVRAVSSPELWRELSLQGSARRQLGWAEAAELIRAAIEKKSGVLARSQRAELVLVLDALRLPGLAFDDVVGAFVRDHREWAAELDFRAIYIVGPDPELIFRLDGQGTVAE
jgi:hypothetical protein